jgi:hypothetical protein
MDGTSQRRQKQAGFLLADWCTSSRRRRQQSTDDRNQQSPLWYLHHIFFLE